MFSFMFKIKKIKTNSQLAANNKKSIMLILILLLILCELYTITQHVHTCVHFILIGFVQDIFRIGIWENLALFTDNVIINSEHELLPSRCLNNKLNTCGNYKREDIFHSYLQYIVSFTDDFLLNLLF